MMIFFAMSNLTLDNNHNLIYTYLVVINEVLNLIGGITMKNYICYENGFERYTEVEIQEVYLKEIDKIEYPTFSIWLTDMLKMGILIEEVE